MTRERFRRDALESVQTNPHRKAQQMEVNTPRPTPQAIAQDELAMVSWAAGVEPQHVLTVRKGLPAAVRKALGWRLRMIHGMQHADVARFLSMRTNTTQQMIREAASIARLDPYFMQFCTRLEWHGPPKAMADNL